MRVRFAVLVLVSLSACSSPDEKVEEAVVEAPVESCGEVVDDEKYERLTPEEWKRQTDFRWERNVVLKLKVRYRKYGNHRECYWHIEDSRIAPGVGWVRSLQYNGKELKLDPSRTYILNCSHSSGTDLGFYELTVHSYQEMVEKTPTGGPMGVEKVWCLAADYLLRRNMSA